MKYLPLRKIINIFFLFILCTATSSAAQEQYENFSWPSPNGWQGAIFDVPTWFAKDMLYTGREIIRFHDGFYEKDSNGFWTYAFALVIDQTEEPSTEAIIEESKRYFVGLARGLGDNKVENYPAEKIRVTAKSTWKINGKRKSQVFELQIFDSFTTAQVIKLNAKISTWLCNDKHRVIHYALSPHKISDPIWRQLNQEIDALKCW